MADSPLGLRAALQSQASSKEAQKMQKVALGAYESDSDHDSQKFVPLLTQRRYAKKPTQHHKDEEDIETSLSLITTILSWKPVHRGAVKYIHRIVIVLLCSLSFVGWILNLFWTLSGDKLPRIPGLFEVRLNSDYLSIFVGIMLCSVQVSTFWFGFTYFRGNHLTCLMQDVCSHNKNPSLTRLTIEEIVKRRTRYIPIVATLSMLGGITTNLMLMVFIAKEIPVMSWGLTIFDSVITVISYMVQFGSLWCVVQTFCMVCDIMVLDLNNCITVLNHRLFNSVAEFVKAHTEMHLQLRKSTDKFKPFLQIICFALLTSVIINVFIFLCEFSSGDFKIEGFVRMYYLVVFFIPLLVVVRSASSVHEKCNELLFVGNTIPVNEHYFGNKVQFRRGGTIVNTDNEDSDDEDQSNSAAPVRTNDLFAKTGPKNSLPFGNLSEKLEKAGRKDFIIQPQNIIDPAEDYCCFLKLSELSYLNTHLTQWKTVGCTGFEIFGVTITPHLLTGLAYALVMNFITNIATLYL